MHKADFNDIDKSMILQVARKMKSNSCPLAAIVGYVDKEGKPVVAYSYDVNGDVKTYKCTGEKKVPSLTNIYGTAAEWFEEEISELMDVEFEGLVNKGRLFLPEEFDGSGQIIVSPLSELTGKK
jgi:Ni,Fe-hydrogenase III component G